MSLPQHGAVVPESARKNIHNLWLCEVPAFSLVACAADDYDWPRAVRN